MTSEKHKRSEYHRHMNNATTGSTASSNVKGDATSASAKLDPKDGRPVREKFVEADIVAVTQHNGDIKVLKNRYGYSAVTRTSVLFEAEVTRLQSEGRDLKVWRLDWWEAQTLLKGMVSL